MGSPPCITAGHVWCSKAHTSRGLPGGCRGPKNENLNKNPSLHLPLDSLQNLTPNPSHKLCQKLWERTVGVDTIHLLDGHSFLHPLHEDMQFVSVQDSLCQANVLILGGKSSESRDVDLWLSFPLSSYCL